MKDHRAVFRSLRRGRPAPQWPGGGLCLTCPLPWMTQAKVGASLRTGEGFRTHHPTCGTALLRVAPEDRGCMEGHGLCTLSCATGSKGRNAGQGPHHPVKPQPRQQEYLSLQVQRPCPSLCWVWPSLPTALPLSGGSLRA